MSGRFCYTFARGEGCLATTLRNGVSHWLGRAGVAVATLVIRSYQILLAPHLVGGCRHTPSCSAYALEALQRHGMRQGLRLSLRRLWHCRPHGTFGYDPVP